ncbi:hypothetical protein STANM309S_05257 [Streptomyces tanashiensis]
MSLRLAIRPRTTSRSRSAASRVSRSGAPASFSSAKSPASTRRASSTSSSAVSSGMRPISRRYWRNRSEEGPLPPGSPVRRRWTGISGSSSRSSEDGSSEDGSSEDGSSGDGSCDTVRVSVSVCTAGDLQEGRNDTVIQCGVRHIAATRGVR